MSLENRKQTLSLVAEATSAGASLEKAGELLEISPRTFERWEKEPEIPDARQGPIHPPSHSLSAKEQAMIVEISNSARFCDKSPWQIVPTLADEGEFVASESSFYRVLRKHGLLSHRGKSKPRKHQKPAPLIARRPNQIYTWDITYLLSPILGQFYYLYLVMDLFSRKIVGWCVQERESADLASGLMKEICQREGIQKNQLVIHSDNGRPMKGATLLATFHRLGVTPSYSRPKVSDDNPFSESLFRTLKYRPEYPVHPFASLEQARAWVASFVEWYNTEHLHSEIGFVTAESKHQGRDEKILAKRSGVYEAAKSRNPARWSRATRNWERVTEVHLNPGRKPKSTISQPSTISCAPIAAA